jgi:hypothetical protein
VGTWHPWLALSDTGLTTHGNSASAAARRKESAEAPAGTIRNAGCATAASAHRRCPALSAAAITACTGLCGSFAPALAGD